MPTLIKQATTYAVLGALLSFSSTLHSSEGVQFSSAKLINTSTLPAVQTSQSPVGNSEVALFHQTDFLTAGQFTHLYPSFNNGKRKRVRSKLIQSGYTHIYIYIMNQKDYGGPAFNYYENIDRYELILEELVKDGINPVVWLAPDDAPNLHKKYNQQLLISTWERVIPAIDPLVSSYVLGLEMDEYWNSEQQDALGQALRKLTDKPIFVHLRKTKWKPVLYSWASGIIYQYGFNKTASQISQETESVLSLLANHPDKVFIAGEYSIKQPEAISSELGDAAVNAGAQGFGNGGTPFR